MTAGSSLPPACTWCSWARRRRCVPSLALRAATRGSRTTSHTRWAACPAPSPRRHAGPGWSRRTRRRTRLSPLAPGRTRRAVGQLAAEGRRPSGLLWHLWPRPVPASAAGQFGRGSLPPRRWPATSDARRTRKVLRDAVQPWCSRSEKILPTCGLPSGLGIADPSIQSQNRWEATRAATCGAQASGRFGQAGKESKRKKKRQCL